MPPQGNSSIIPQTNQKPVHIFYVWYTELCRRLNSNPAPVVKPAKPKCQTVLNFVADRLKVEEWNPIINALRHDTSLHVITIKSRIGHCQFLHEIDTEEKLRQMKRRSGLIWTAFILKSLLKSLSCTIRNTQVLTCLELDGLPMFAQYLEPLMKALQKNKTLKKLALTRCRISDPGCQVVCSYVKFAPNIEVLNLSSCALTHTSGEHIGKLIKYQQINRYCESWHNSLRYADLDLQIMRGLKRITLNNNPEIGDTGLSHIINELDDDLWIKALDMQKCGLTEKSGMRLIDLVNYSQSLEVADFRLNEQLSVETLNTVVHILQKKSENHAPEYQWCSVTYSVACDSVFDSVSNYSAIKPPSVYKTKSAPLKAVEQKLSMTKPVRKAKTVSNIPKKDLETEKKVEELSTLLQAEIAKRQESEKINRELQNQLNTILGRNIKAKGSNSKDIPIEMLSKICNTNGVKKSNGLVNGVKNGFHGKNGHATACTIFQKLIGLEEHVHEDDLTEFVPDDSKQQKKMTNGMNMTNSQVSLVNFLEDLKHTNMRTSVQVTSQSKILKYKNSAKRT